MRISVLVASLFLSACAGTPRESVTIAPVVAAERAFAAHAREHGWIPAFRAFTAPDGLVMQPEPVSAPQSLAQTPDDGNRSLYWWPAFAGIARSGDFGFTTGPYVTGSDAVRGHYFTVWRRQPDGSWKWIYDGGPPVRDSAPFPRDGEPVALSVAAHGLGSAAAAVAAVTALEREHADDAALRAFVAADARVNRARAAPGMGPAAAYARPAGSVRYVPVRADGSGAGDMVFTINETFWAGEEGARGGHVMRIWQLRPEGWRIVYDQLLPRPPPRPAEPATP